MRLTRRAYAAAALVAAIALLLAWLVLTRGPELPPDLPGSLVFVSDRDGASALYVRPLPRGRERRLTNFSEPLRDPAVSPDGARVAFSMSGRLGVVELSSGEVTMLTLGVVSVLAMILGAVGLYGVLAYVVAERTREIGVRMALGATAGTVRRMVVSQGAKVVLAGVVVGVAAAVASTRLLKALLYEVSAVDPSVFVAMSITMIGIGLLASYVPARRASNVDAIESLRND